VNGESLRENPGFKEIWDRGIKIEEFWRKRQAQRVGIVNAKFIVYNNLPLSVIVF
jgi:hypothetical protein